MLHDFPVYPKVRVFRLGADWPRCWYAETNHLLLGPVQTNSYTKRLALRRLRNRVEDRLKAGKHYREQTDLEIVNVK